MQYTTVTAMVPDGQGWKIGEHYVWSERSTHLPRRWVYWHTTIKTDIGKAGWCSETSTMEESYSTRKDALAHGEAYIRKIYRA